MPCAISAGRAEPTRDQLDEQQLRAEVLAPIASPDLHRLYDYWRARCKDGLLPSRADIDPLELPSLLGNLVLVDVLREPLRFRYRLAGSSLVMARGVDLTGRMVDDHPDREFRKLVLANYALVANTGRPLAIRRDTRMDDRVRRCDALYLPLASDGVTVDMILVGMRDLGARH